MAENGDWQYIVNSKRSRVLYHSYEEALEVCPDGWQLPTEADWLEAAAAAGAEGAQAYDTIEGIAAALMGNGYFNEDLMWEDWPQVGDITNATGLSFIPTGYAVVKNQFMAEDAAQDAFVTAWMKLNTLQEPKKYGSWVCRIAKNCALNMISRYRSFLPLDVVDNLNITDDGAENPAELYALSEERNEVNKSIEMLPEKVRQIIRLHYFDNLSIAEIADRMRISEGTVKRQLHDGRKRIRKELCAMNEK